MHRRNGVLAPVTQHLQNGLHTFHPGKGNHVTMGGVPDGSGKGQALLPEERNWAIKNHIPEDLREQLWKLPEKRSWEMKDYIPEDDGL